MVYVRCSGHLINGRVLSPFVYLFYDSEQIAIFHDDVFNAI